MISSHLLQQLRNTSVRELIQALERDGFTFRRTRGAGRVYRHPDGRRAVIHYHHARDTLPLGTLEVSLPECIGQKMISGDSG